MTRLASGTDLCESYHRFMPEKFFDHDHIIVCTWVCTVFFFGLLAVTALGSRKMFITSLREFGDRKKKKKTLGKLH